MLCHYEHNYRNHVNGNKQRFLNTNFLAFDHDIDLDYDLDLQSQPILGQGRPPCQNQCQWSNGSTRRVHTTKQMNRLTDAHCQIDYLIASLKLRGR